MVVGVSSRRNCTRSNEPFVEPMFGEYVRRLDEGLVGAGTPSRRTRAEQDGQTLPGSG